MRTFFFSPTLSLMPKFVFRVGALAIALLTPVLANAQCPPLFTKVIDGGFGDRFNIYGHGVVNFGNHLYIGTLNEHNGSEIWRYDGTTWEQVVDAGLDSITNESVRSLIVFGGQLYAGTYNPTNGAEVWRSNDGVNWEKKLVAGFGDTANISVRGMEVFNGYLYIGTQNNVNPGQLWRTVDGDFWEPVTLTGFGNPNNSSIHFLKEFSGKLYAGTRNTPDGTELWRSTDGVDFVPVVGSGASTPSGFGLSNGAIFSMGVFLGQLFVGTADWINGFSVHRSRDGRNFTLVTPNGFGDKDNVYAWIFRVHEDALWLGGMNKNVGIEGARLWRTFDGNTWEEMVGPSGTYMSDGFDDLHNWGIRNMVLYKGKLHLTTGQCWYTECDPIVTGTQVWQWSGETTCGK